MRAQRCANNLVSPACLPKQNNIQGVSSGSSDTPNDLVKLCLDLLLFCSRLLTLGLSCLDVLLQLLDTSLLVLLVVVKSGKGRYEEFDLLFLFNDDYVPAVLL